jgi:hypothetical protein
MFHLCELYTSIQTAIGTRKTLSDALNPSQYPSNLSIQRARYKPLPKRVARRLEPIEVDVTEKYSLNQMRKEDCDLALS